MPASRRVLRATFVAPIVVLPTSTSTTTTTTTVGSDGVISGSGSSTSSGSLSGDGDGRPAAENPVRESEQRDLQHCEHKQRLYWLCSSGSATHGNSFFVVRQQCAFGRA